MRQICRAWSSWRNMCSSVLIGNRTYNAGFGAFTSCNPLGYVDGNSLYAGYFAMVLAMDPTGLWHFKDEPTARSQKGRATVVADGDDDSYASLAEMVKLEESEIRLWLKDWKANGEVEDCDEFTLPNTVYSYVGSADDEDSLTVRNWATYIAINHEASDYARDVGRMGYHVKTTNFPRLNFLFANGLSCVKSQLGIGSPDIVGFAFFGHGPGLLFFDDGVWVHPRDLIGSLHHRLAFVTLYACYSATNAESDASTPGWDRFVSSHGTLRAINRTVLGGIDDWDDIPVVE